MGKTSDSKKKKQLHNYSGKQKPSYGIDNAPGRVQVESKRGKKMELTQIQNYNNPIYNRTTHMRLFKIPPPLRGEKWKRKASLSLYARSA